MEQYFKILKNKFFTSTTISQSVSNLQYEDNYYFNPTGDSIEVVDFSNVRGFLANANNKRIVNAYYSFITASTLMNAAYPSTTIFSATSSFKTIYYDDEKLADSFNSYYNQVYLRGQNVNLIDAQKNVIDNQLLSSSNYIYSSQTIYDNNFFYSSNTTDNTFVQQYNLFTASTLSLNAGHRNVNGIDKKIEQSLDDSYYITVLLKKTSTQMARMSFELCDDYVFKNIGNYSTYSQNIAEISKYNQYFQQISDITGNGNISSPGYIGSGNTSGQTSSNGKTYLLQCFINPNFKINENEIWKDNFSGDGYNYINSISGRTNYVSSGETDTPFQIGEANY